MTQPATTWPRSRVAMALGLTMLAVLVFTVIGLVVMTTPADLMAGLRHPLFAPALWLTVRTSLVSLALVLAAGTPLAWWLARSRGRAARLVEPLVSLPIVMPPAVMGIALLQTLGRNGLFGPALAAIGWDLPFSSAAVIAAQLVVSAPFYVLAAAAAFRRVDEDLLIVARTLGKTPSGAFLRVALPLAAPGLTAGAAVAWARAVGEFGATLLFAGNLTGTSQTMPLAILTALETDVRAAVALALVLGAFALITLGAVRLAPAIWMALARPGGARNGS